MTDETATETIEDVDALDVDVDPNSLIQFSPRAKHASAPSRIDPDVDALEVKDRAGSAPVQTSIERLLDRYGVAFEYPASEPAPIEMTAREALADVPDDDPNVALVRLRDTGAMWETPLIGQVGTPLRGGRLQAEPTARYSSFRVRGYSGNAGLYEEFYRSETQIYDAVTTQIDSVRSHMPIVRMPKRFYRSHESALRHFVAAQNAAFANFRCNDYGLPTMLAELARAVYLGCATLEPSYRRLSSGGYIWHRAEPREPAAIYRWHMSRDRLAAIEYLTTQTDTDAPSRFILPTGGARAIDRAVIHFRINAFGNDFGGLPGTRPASHWIAMKRLIAQIAASGLDKWGNPILLLKKEPELLKALEEAGLVSTPGSMRKAHKTFVDQRATDVPIHYLGNGVGIQLVAPTGAQPTLLDWLRYIDDMVGFAFTNDGNFQHYANYKAAEVNERRTIKSGVGLAKKIEEVLQHQIVAPLACDQIPGLIEPPRFELVPPASGSASDFHDNVLKALGPNPPAVDDWPEPLRREYFRRLGVDMEKPEIYDSNGNIYRGADVTPDAESGEGAQAKAPANAEKVADTAYNGAQVTALQGILEAVSAGSLAPESAIAMLQAAFVMDAERARNIVGPAAEMAGRPLEPRDNTTETPEA